MSPAPRLAWFLLAAAAASADAPLSGGREPASREFEFTYQALVRDTPAGAKSVLLWIPYPPDDEDQTVRDVRIEASAPYESVTEPKHRNRALRFVLAPGSAEQKVSLSFRVTRRERVRRPDAGGSAGESASAAELAAWLQRDRRVPIDGKIKTWAEETVAGKLGPVDRARAIYDYAVTNLKYDKSGTGWGQGDIFFACDAKRGNCTDFHSLFIGYNRALGIPARFEIGFPLPPARGQGEIGGYHCWAQFYAPGPGWVPVDASEASKHPEKREYFFGAHDENRVLFTAGRDLTLPGMKGDPLNFFVYPYAEVDGRPWVKVERSFTYRDLP